MRNGLAARLRGRERDLVAVGLVVAAGIVAAGSVVLGTAAYGPGTYYDSVVYLSVANGIRDGTGLVMHNGEPLAIWPPGYPVALAVVGAVFRVASVNAVRLANAGALGLTVLLVGALTHRVTASRVAAVLAAAFVALSASSLELAMFAVAELVFTVWYLAVAVCLTLFARGHHRGWLVAAGGATAAAILTKYVGVTFVPVGLVLVAIVSARTRWRRLVDAGIYGAASMLPVVPLVVWNLTASGSLTGERLAARYVLGDSLGYLTEAVATWLVPTGSLRIERMPLGLLAAALAGLTLVIAVALLWWRRRSLPREHAVLLLALGGLALAGTAGLIVASVTTKVDPFFQRQILPYLPGATVIAAAGAVRLPELAGRWGLRRLVAGVLVATAVALVGLNVRGALNTVQDNRAAGVGGLTTKAERSVPFRQLVEEHLPDGPVVSNGAELVYLETGRRVPYTPRIAKLKRLVAEHPVHLIYYDYGRYPDRVPRLEALRAAFDVQPVVTGRGGMIVTLSRP